MSDNAKCCCRTMKSEMNEKILLNNEFSWTNDICIMRQVITKAPTYLCCIFNTKFSFVKELREPKLFILATSPLKDALISLRCRAMLFDVKLHQECIHLVDRQMTCSHLLNLAQPLLLQAACFYYWLPRLVNFGLNALQSET